MLEKKQNNLRIILGMCREKGVHGWGKMGSKSRWYLKSSGQDFQEEGGIFSKIRIIFAAQTAITKYHRLCSLNSRHLKIE
jgi:hypothetical protein